MRLTSLLGLSMRWLLSTTYLGAESVHIFLPLTFEVFIDIEICVCKLVDVVLKDEQSDVCSGSEIH